MTTPHVSMPRHATDDGRTIGKSHDRWSFLVCGALGQWPYAPENLSALALLGSKVGTGQAEHHIASNVEIVCGIA